MKQISIMMVLFLFLIAAATPLRAEDNLGKRLVQSCKADLETYCSDVKPGGGRMLSCLHAHADKLSEQCAAVAKEAGEEMKLMAAAMAYVKEKCGADFDQYCKDVKPGQGRLLKCLDDNDAHISQQCKDALKEVGWRD